MKNVSLVYSIFSLVDQPSSKYCDLFLIESKGTLNFCFISKVIQKLEILAPIYLPQSLLQLSTPSNDYTVKEGKEQYEI